MLKYVILWCSRKSPNGCTILDMTGEQHKKSIEVMASWLLKSPLRSQGLSVENANWLKSGWQASHWAPMVFRMQSQTCVPFGWMKQSWPWPLQIQCTPICTRWTVVKGFTEEQEDIGPTENGSVHTLRDWEDIKQVIETCRMQYKHIMHSHSKVLSLHRSNFSLNNWAEWKIIIKVWADWRHDPENLRNYIGSGRQEAQSRVCMRLKMFLGAKALPRPGWWQSCLHRTKITMPPTLNFLW